MTHHKKASALWAFILSSSIAIIVVVLIMTLKQCQLGGDQKPLAQVIQQSSITVFPAVVRTQDGTTYNTQTAQSIRAFLQEKTDAQVSVSTVEIDMTGTIPEKGFQYDIFQNSMKHFGEYVKQHHIKTEYALLTDYLISRTPNGEYGVGGIHCYVVKQNGERAYGLILNSHHPNFQQGGLQTDDGTPDGLNELVNRCTDVLLKTLSETE